MSLYAIKDEDGTYLRDDGDLGNDQVITFNDHASAKSAKNFHGGHVVELVEKAEPVEVSEEAGKTLADLYQEICYGGTDQYAADYVRELHTAGMSIEDIFRALDVGWTVKQPQRWYVKAPKEWSGNEKTSWFYKDLDGAINTVRDSSRARTFDEQFTAEEIDKYHLGGFETVEVTEHDK